jgi:hypothetical protein
MKLTEKQKLENCISSIDELIKLEEQKLELLKKHRIGLIQQMSVLNVVVDCELLGLKHNWCHQHQLPRYCSICNKED